MAADPTLADAVDELVRGGSDAAHALAQAFGTYREMLAGAGGYLAERVADLDDVRDRAVAAVLGRPMPGVPDPGHPVRAGRRRPRPGRHGGLDPATVLALVTERGGPTSHTAILARSLGLPGGGRGCRGAAGLADGTVVAGGRRRPGRSRSASTGRRRRALAAARAAGLRGQRPGRTADGHPVQLLLNIGSAPRTWGRRRPPTPRGSGCSGPSSCSSTGTTCRPRPSSRPRTRRRSGPRAGARSCCGRWTRAPTSRCRSSGCGRSPTRPWAYGGCGWRGCGRRC